MMKIETLEALKEMCSNKCATRPQVWSYFVAPEMLVDKDSEFLAATGEYVVVGENRIQVLDREMFDSEFDIIHTKEPIYDTSEIPQTC